VDLYPLYFNSNATFGILDPSILITWPNVVLGGVMVITVAFGLKVRGFKPG
jgi:hypothetical protein